MNCKFYKKTGENYSTGFCYVVVIMLTMLLLAHRFPL